jgi:hypothetical protein
MAAASSATRSFVSERNRLPLAGTRITTNRGALWDRPAPGAPSEYTEAVESVDRDARRLATREAHCRLIQAQLVASLVKRRLWRALGFARLPDYAAERLGVHARTLQEDARVVTALELLPTIRAAFCTGALRWTHARLLAGVATPESESEWLRLALVSTTRRLAELVKAARARSATEKDAPPSADAGESCEAAPGPDACAFAAAAIAAPDPSACAPPIPDACAPGPDARALGPDACVPGPDACGPGPDACAPGPDAGAWPDPDACALPGAGASATPGDDDTADPPLLWTILVTRTGRRLWRTVGDLASRMCGVDVPTSRVAEAVAAEAMSWEAWEPPLAEPLPRRAARSRAAGESPEHVSRSDTAVAAFEPDPDLQSLVLDLDAADAHEVDRRLRSVRTSMQKVDAELGEALRKAREHDIPRRLGLADLRLYAEARLGVCGSKAMALVRLDRQCALRSPLLLRAYREGHVTWLAATTLLPVISRQHENAWIARAGQVTLRRLEAEVSWALDRADDAGGKAHQAPPPLELDVTADALARCRPADIQMRAHPQTDLESFGRRVDARIGIVLPESIALLLDDAIEGCRHAIEPRWRGFERILAHAWITWMALPQHENPVYARDSHRCQVPGCRNRGPLHAHHVWFRSTGGPDFDWNLTSVCEEHHRAIHRGDIRVRGRAPNGLIWEMGCRPGRPPLMRLRGEVYWKG